MKCPQCQSKNWETGPKHLKYDFGSIEQGETREYPLYTDQHTGAPDEKKNMNLWSAYKSYCRRNPARRFGTQHIGYKMIVTRLI